MTVRSFGSNENNKIFFWKLLTYREPLNGPYCIKRFISSFRIILTSSRTFRGRSPIRQTVAGRVIFWNARYSDWALVKFINSQKATKFKKIFLLLLISKLKGALSVNYRENFNLYLLLVREQLSKYSWYDLGILHGFYWWVVYPYPIQFHPPVNGSSGIPVGNRMIRLLYG